MARLHCLSMTSRILAEMTNHPNLFHPCIVSTFCAQTLCSFYFIYLFSLLLRVSELPWLFGLLRFLLTRLRFRNFFGVQNVCISIEG